MCGSPAQIGRRVTCCLPPVVRWTDGEMITGWAEDRALYRWRKESTCRAGVATHAAFMKVTYVRWEG